MISTFWARKSALKDRALANSKPLGAALPMSWSAWPRSSGAAPGRRGTARSASVELARARRRRATFLSSAGTGPSPDSLCTLRQDAGRTVTLAVAQWALIYDAICAEAGSPEWSSETRRAIATLHNDALAAHAVVAPGVAAAD